MLSVTETGTMRTALVLLGALTTAGARVDAAAEEAASSPNMLIVYYSKTGYTEQLAEAIATGARTVIPEANVRVQNVNETSVPDDVLTWADGILLGSPTYFGNPAAGLLSWVDTAWEPFWTDPRFSQKYGAAFATGGGMAQGVEHVNSCIQRLLASFRIEVLHPDPTRSGYASYGPVAVTGTFPFNGTEIAKPWLDAAATFGVKFSTILSREVNDRRLLESCKAPQL